MTEQYFVIEGAPLIPDAVRKVKHFAFDGQALAFDTIEEVTAFAEHYGYHGHVWQITKINLDHDSPTIDCGEIGESHES